jgi:YesN/AraC family two-component response regulator
LVLILPFQIHQLYVLPHEHLTITKIAFSLDSVFNSNGFGHDLYQLIFSNQPSVIHADTVTTPIISNIFETLLIEQKGTSLWKEKMLQTKLIELLITLDRIRHKVKSDQVPVDTSSTNQTLWDIAYYIHKNFSQVITLETLSSHFHWNKNYISTSFSKLFGQSFISFLTEIRLQNACSLLSSTELSITEISYHCGFPTYNAFSRSFSKVKGMTPREFRVACQSKKSSTYILD